MILYYHHRINKKQFITVNWADQGADNWVDRPPDYISFRAWDLKREIWGIGISQLGVGIIKRPTLKALYNRTSKAKFLIETL